MWKSTVLEAFIHFINRELDELDKKMDVWDRTLQIVLNDYASRYEPPPDLWEEIKTKVQRELVLNQVQSCTQ